MPELPEVETTRRGLEPLLQGRRIETLTVHNANLRWPVPDHLPELMQGRTITGLRRRAKYLLMDTDGTGLLLHLGMSGSLRCCPASTLLRVHDHLLFRLDDGQELRFHDPRRFGCCLPLPYEMQVGQYNPAQGSADHPLLAALGPEPLDEAAFDGAYLYARSRGRRIAVKAFIMDQQIVVGVGNIYASEALFRAGIRPTRDAGRISRIAYGRLVDEIRSVLNAALAQGGTTLRDFVREDGSHGYFRQSLQVYGRAGEGCLRCGTVLKDQRIGNRSSTWCPRCQK